MPEEVKTIEQLEAEIREFFTTNATGREDSFFRRTIDIYAWQQEQLRRQKYADRDREHYKKIMPRVLAELSGKVTEIVTKWPARFNSNHEALGVILEEVRELETEVYKKENTVVKGRIREEAADIAAVAIRLMIENTDERGAPIIF